MRRHRQTGYSNIAVLVVKPSAYSHADTILSDVLATGLFEVLVRRDIALPSSFWSTFYNDYARSNQAEIEAAMASGPCRAVLLCGSRASHHRHLVAARSLRGLVVGQERRPGGAAAVGAALRDLKATALLRLPIQKLRAYAAAIGVTNSRGDSDQAAIAGIPRAALVRAINTARERGARRGSVDDLAASWAVADDALLIGATTPDRNGGAAASAQSATSATPGSGFAQARTVTDSHRDSIAAVAEAGAAASALSGSKDNAVAGAVAEVCTNVEARGISECFISFNCMTEYFTNLM
jgi:hypothetical protein